MKKLLLILFMLLSILSYAQPDTRRIEDVLNPGKTTIQIEKEKYKSRLDSASKSTSNCVDMVVKYRLEAEKLKKQADSLKTIIGMQSLALEKAKTQQKLAEKSLNPEVRQKQLFAKLAVGEGAIILGGIVGLVTGAWVPVCIAVGVVELYLLVEGKVQISVKQTKI
jgi:hypothetical protein